jgi:hypothetical protein
LPRNICSQLYISTKKNLKINPTIKKLQEELGYRLMTVLKNLNEQMSWKKEIVGIAPNANRKERHSRRCAFTKLQRF